MSFQLTRKLQKRIANTSIGASTARNMGPEGTIAAAREYLGKMNLRRFSKPTETEFMAQLNGATTIFLRYLPIEASSYWGAARKFLNIFLRGVFYNRFLCEEYALYSIEPWLEVPLDSHVARGLRSELGGSDLPRWKTVIGLTPEVSKIYQMFAGQVARRKGTYRVHLDLIYWRATRSASNRLHK